ncbi:MAG: vitamin K epoxide reductase family protein [Candidatus Electrothrix communis]|nr:thioredoxin domain-containing protein [Desulfobulbus sp. US4]WLE98295.1 MAG: vitamin K epoxide reductase family protein [Candidatus Electrothrix communis]
MKQKTLPYRVYTVPILVLAAIGIAASAYLGLSHYRNYTDIGYSSFCALSQSINCDTVSQSPWSILLGLPVAFWGILGYTILFLLALPAQVNTEGRRGLWELLFLLSLLFSLVALYFGYITATKIGSYCIVCILTYVVSFSLLFSTWIIRRRFNSHSFFAGIQKGLKFLLRQKITLSLLVLLLLSFGALRILIPAYWEYQYPQLSEKIAKGVTEEGHPWIGAKNPKLVIKEFTDYQCFQCSKAHFFLRLLVDKYPDKIRLVHYHYPMDEKFNTVLVKEPFHTGSGMLALLTIAAAGQNKFWEANDALYAVIQNGITTFNIKEFSEKIQLDAEQLKKDMHSESALKRVESDIRTGLKNNILGTPSFIVGDKMYAGRLPNEILDIINEE